MILAPLALAADFFALPGWTIPAALRGRGDHVEAATEIELTAWLLYSVAGA